MPDSHGKLLALRSPAHSRHRRNPDRVDRDPQHVEGQDTIGVDLCLAALDAVRDRLALAAERRERVLLATGHLGGGGGLPSNGQL